MKIIFMISLVLILIILLNGCQSTVYQSQKNLFKAEEIGLSIKKFGYVNRNSPKYYVIMSNGIVLLTDTLYKVDDAFIITKIKEKAYE